MMLTYDFETWQKIILRDLPKFITCPECNGLGFSLCPACGGHAEVEVKNIIDVHLYDRMVKFYERKLALWVDGLAMSVPTVHAVGYANPMRAFLQAWGFYLNDTD